MIGKITGIVALKGADHALVDVQGVGYEIFLSDITLSNLPKVGNPIALYTELVVREDLLQLVGFSSLLERDWYRLLISVQGVGSKAALKILGTVSTQSLSRAILTADIDTIKSVQGIGPKIAQRIVSELKEKASQLMHDGLSDTNENFMVSDSQLRKFDPNLGEENLKIVNDEQSRDNTKEKKLEQMQSDALSALFNLGYSRSEAAVAITNVLIENDAVEKTSELIKIALKSLAAKE